MSSVWNDTGRDKWWHFLLSFVLVVVIYYLQGLCCPCKIWVRRVVSAGLLTFLLGLAKEAADAVSDKWPWCNPTCTFETGDLIADLVGCVTGCLILVWMHCCCCCEQKRNNCNSSSRSLEEPQQQDNSISNEGNV
jgi:uncharacterized membrane protein YhaH (DUF805 family)